MSTSNGPQDPVFVHATREALLILLVWAGCLVWSVWYCTAVGYTPNGDQVRTILGMPRWVFWGIAAPWVVADIFTVWFCFFYMADDDLGEAQEGRDLAEEVTEQHTEKHDA